MNSNTRRYALSAAALFAGAAVAGSTLAHHSYAAFDRNKTVTITGVISDIEWTNPHTWVFVMAPGPDGKVTRWAIEGDGPGAMTRRGWKRDSAKVGDRVTLVINPLITGQLGGHYVEAELPGGLKIVRD